ncbi:MAG: type II secretion system protein [bacterium]
MIRYTKSQKGFTLIEILLATAILGYVILAVMGLFNYVTVSTKASEFSTLATNYARQKMEDIKNRDFDTIPEGTWTQEQATLGQEGRLVFTRAVTVSYMEVSAGVLITSMIATDLKQVGVSVTWNESGENKEIVLTSLVSRHL